jgi:hypothetical protein
VAAVAAFAKVRGERLGALRRGMALAIAVHPQRRRKAFLMFAAGNVAGERLAVEDYRQDAILAMEPLEAFDLFVDPVRLGSRR